VPADDVRTLGGAAGGRRGVGTGVAPAASQRELRQMAVPAFGSLALQLRAKQVTGGPEGGHTELPADVAGTTMNTGGPGWLVDKAARTDPFAPVGVCERRRGGRVSV